MIGNAMDIEFIKIYYQSLILTMKINIITGTNYNYMVFFF